MTGGVDKAVRQWSLADGTLARTFGGPTDIVTGVSLSGDGTKLAAVGLDKTLRVWPVAVPVAGQAAQPVAPAASIVSGQPMRGVSFSPDGTRVGTSGDDGVVRVWNVATGREQERLPGHVGVVPAVAFAADNTTLISGGADMTARLWTLAATRDIVASAMKLNAMALTADGTKLAVAGDDKLVRLFLTADGKPAGEAAGSIAALSAVALRHDGLQMAAGGADMALYLWPLTAAGPGPAVKVVVGAVISTVAYSSDGTRVAVGGADNLVRVFDSADGRLLELIPTTAPTPSLTFLPSAMPANSFTKAGSMFSRLPDSTSCTGRLFPAGYSQRITFCKSDFSPTDSGRPTD